MRGTDSFSSKDQLVKLGRWERFKIDGLTQFEMSNGALIGTIFGVLFGCLCCCVVLCAIAIASGRSR